MPLNAFQVVVLVTECRCVKGYFSKDNNECKPWTNCEEKHQRTLNAGTQTEDAVCSDETTGEIGYIATTTTVTSTARSVSQQFTTSGKIRISAIITSRLPTTTEKEHNQYYILPVLMIAIGLMCVIMPAAYLLGKTAIKKMKNKPRNDGSWRIPVQEENVNSNSALVKSITP
nr:PREDICTED: tumor necrosis factor receptor superfamily member 4-like [Latimeria chalumnae]|eukprot:XP_014341470.1 PREDICTED: tumor necrosis factor receptor superfamily member 4-like [Latimeria chalumnae]